MDQFSRNALAIGVEGVAAVKETCVAILGVGGVGSFAAESLARSGVGTLILVDKDTIDITNINRQIHATLQTIGESKCQMMRQRIASINPDCEVIIFDTFLNADNIEAFFTDNAIDYVVDAIDTISVKSLVMQEAIKHNIKIISSMGMANKLDVTAIKVCDLMETKYDPIARILRRDIRAAKLDKHKIAVVCSEEIPLVPREEVLAEIGKAESIIRKQQLPPSSNSFVPAVAGLFCGNYIFNDIITTHEITINRKKS